MTIKKRFNQSAQSAVKTSVPSTSSQAVSSSMSVSSTLPKFTSNDAVEFLSKWSKIISRTITGSRGAIVESYVALNSFSLSHLCIHDPFIVKLCDKLFFDPDNVCVTFLPVQIIKSVDSFVHMFRMLDDEYDELKHKCTFILRVCLSCLISPPCEDVVPEFFSDEVSRFAEYYTTDFTPFFHFKSSVHDEMYSRLIEMLSNCSNDLSNEQMRELWHLAISKW